MFINRSLICLLSFGILFLTSCEKDEPDPPNQEEVITTLTYTLTPADGGETVVLSFRDLDGDGGNAPEISGGTLSANTTYEGVLNLLNETESPAESITDEIQEEADEHQFFFTSTLPGLSFVYLDQDDNGAPLGLSSALTTDNEADGSITVILRHEPNKSATGVADGDITNAGGETDIEVTFPVDVQ